ncbi:MAG TPA: PASTA domain-containing protein [Balneolaceae bacterium]|nr:PASTA domain-containing protein [Balneola sp.]HBQ60217.1 PASTA domain-containing protein [Balneolaceae bacterium]|tara:strand:+ start:8818 stop:9663 length:846 start_codon:yes stop_codon:yes gene_type:complete
MGMLKYIFTNKYFYIGSLAIILFGAASLYIADKLIMPAYTNYNEGVTVPDVTRISLEEAQDLLTDYGLRFEVTDRRANSAFPADYVIDQSPGASNIVKPNRKIYLTVNTEVKPQVVVPGVVDLSLRNAEIQLQNYGLQVGSRSYESSRFKTIIRQSIPEGTTVEKGAVVDLVVGDGLGSRMVTIPEIIGLQLPEAQLKLRETGLRVEAVQFRPTKDMVPNTVLDYSPKKEEFREGESITLTISERFEVEEESEGGAVIIDSTGNDSGIPPDSLNNQPNQQD